MKAVICFLLSACTEVACSLRRRRPSRQKRGLALQKTPPPLQPQPCSLSPKPQPKALTLSPSLRAPPNPLVRLKGQLHRLARGVACQRVVAGEAFAPIISSKTDPSRHVKHSGSRPSPCRSWHPIGLSMRLCIRKISGEEAE